MSGQNDDEKLPEVARRRGNADTLFSADWFDDDDDEQEPAEARPDIAAPAMYEPEVKPAKPSSPPASPPPPKRLSNPTILPDFDMEDDDPAPPPEPKPSKEPASRSSDDALPEVAKRRGNADTLFSADWFDDDDGGDDAGPSTPAPAASSAEPDVPPAPKSNTMLYVGVAIGFLVLTCAGIGTGVGVVMLFR